MTRRTGRIVLQVVVVLGLVVPFVVGAVSPSLLRRIAKYSATIPFRSRFDAVQIGMTETEVENLLGRPSQDEWIDPTHAETWLSEAAGVSHKMWGPPWKVYWLLTTVDDRSHWWSSNPGSQAFVLFDGNRMVKGKMWLEERRQE